MINKHIALTLVFLGAVTSVNADNNKRQTDEPLLASISSATTQSAEVADTRTVSPLESRELREHFTKQVDRSLAAKLDALLVMQTAHSERSN